MGKWVMVLEPRIILSGMKLFNKFIGFRVNSAIYRTEKAPKLKCVLECHTTDGCKGFNFDENQSVCEFFTASDQVQKQDNFDYYEF